MKNIITKILIILIIITFCILGFFIYGEAKDDKEEIDKIEGELEYLDIKITNLINSLNGIKLENYKISISKTQESEGNKNSGSTEKESSKKEEDQEGDESKQETEITKMEEEQIASESEQVNWNFLQGETEILYSAWSTIVLDLYNKGANSEQIVGFSNMIDQTLIGLKEKDKAKTAQNLAAMYAFLPEFANYSKIDDLKKNTIKTKSHIINSYAFLQNEDWDKVQQEVYNAEKKFSEIMKNLNNKEEQRKYNINKTYILIQELRNSLATKEPGIFYVKYKNLLEEMNVLF